MRTFFLGSGIFTYTMPYLTDLLPKKESVHIALIATASDPEPDKWYVSQARAQLQEAGIHILDIDLKNEIADSLWKKLIGIDAIYVTGGNTFYLLDWVRKSGFDNVLPKLLDRGTLYIGSSAGSYIVCPTIQVANWKGVDKNKFGITDFTALNLIPFYFFAHYEEKYKLLIEENYHSLAKPLIVLTDRQAVVMKGENYEIIGEGQPLVYTV